MNLGRSFPHHEKPGRNQSSEPLLADHTLIDSLERNNDSMAGYIWRLVKCHPHCMVDKPKNSSRVAAASESSRTWNWREHEAEQL